MNQSSDRHGQEADIRAQIQDRHSGADELLKEKHFVVRDFTIFI